MCPVKLIARGLFFWLGTHFFFIYELQDRHPRHRRAFVPIWWIFTGIPTDAEVPLYLLQHRDFNQLPTNLRRKPKEQSNVVGDAEALLSIRKSGASEASPPPDSDSNMDKLKKRLSDSADRGVERLRKAKKKMRIVSVKASNILVTDSAPVPPVESESDSDEDEYLTYSALLHGIPGKIDLVGDQLVFSARKGFHSIALVKDEFASAKENADFQGSRRLLSISVSDIDACIKTNSLTEAASLEITLVDGITHRWSPETISMPSVLTDFSHAIQMKPRLSLRLQCRSQSTLHQPTRLLLLGAPGSGKGTHAGSLTTNYNLSLIVAGDLLRNHVNRGTALGKEMQQVMKSGLLLSDDLIWQTIEPVLTTKKDENCVLDGFPRTIQQAKRFDEYLHAARQRLDLIINLDVPDSVILERIEGRWIHLPSQRQYNTTFNPPKVAGKDDITGEDLVKRVDDDAATFKIRLDKYHEHNGPLLEHYQDSGRLVTVSGPTSKLIWPQIAKIMQEKFPQLVRVNGKE